MLYTVKDYPSPGILKWAMLVVLHETDKPIDESEIDLAVAYLLELSDAMYHAVMENGKKYVPYRSVGKEQNQRNWATLRNCKLPLDLGS